MKREVEVKVVVEVEIDESKFTDEFMEEFRIDFYNFKDIDDHIEHLAQLYARGIVCNNDEIEGYGPTKDMGIKFRDSYVDVDILD